MDMLTLLTLDPRTPLWVTLPAQSYGFHASCLASHSNAKGLVANAHPIMPSDTLRLNARRCWGCGHVLWTL